MRPQFFVFLLSFLCNTSFAKIDLYPGMVKLVIGTHISYGTSGDLSKNKSDTVVFRFYQSPQDTKISRQLSFYFDWSQIPSKEKIVEKDYHAWLNPMSFNDDTASGYFGIYLTCKSQQGDWLEVIVNEKTQETLWIKNKRFVHFLSWNELTKKEKFVSITAKTKLYSRPDTSSTAISYPGINCFEILKVKGDWMQISNRSSELCGNYDKPFLDKVWINFKSNDKLFIDVLVQ